MGGSGDGDASLPHQPFLTSRQAEELNLKLASAADDSGGFILMPEVDPRGQGILRSTRKISVGKPPAAPPPAMPSISMVPKPALAPPPRVAAEYAGNGLSRAPTKSKTPNPSSGRGGREPASKRQKSAKSAGPMSANEAKECARILEVLRTNPKAYWFLRPVDPAELPDYHTVIKEPMDLGTVKSKLDDDEYGTIFDFAEDVQRIFTNCRTYNAPGSAAFVNGEEMERIFDKRFEVLKRKREKAQEKGPSGGGGERAGRGGGGGGGGGGRVSDDQNRAKLGQLLPKLMQLMTAQNPGMALGLTSWFGELQRVATNIGDQGTWTPAGAVHNVQSMIDGLESSGFAGGAPGMPGMMQMPQAAPAPPQEKEIDWKEMQRISAGLRRLTADQLVKAVKIISKKHPHLTGGDNFNLELDDLDQGTLRQLRSFLEMCEADKKKKKKKVNPAARLGEVQRMKAVADRTVRNMTAGRPGGLAQVGTLPPPAVPRPNSSGNGARKAPATFGPLTGLPARPSKSGSMAGPAAPPKVAAAGGGDDSSSESSEDEAPVVKKPNYGGGLPLPLGRHKTAASSGGAVAGGLLKPTIQNRAAWGNLGPRPAPQPARAGPTRFGIRRSPRARPQRPTRSRYEAGHGAVHGARGRFARAVRLTPEASPFRAGPGREDPPAGPEGARGGGRGAPRAARAGGRRQEAPGRGGRATQARPDRGGARRRARRAREGRRWWQHGGAGVPHGGV